LHEPVDLHARALVARGGYAAERDEEGDRDDPREAREPEQTPHDATLLSVTPLTRSTESGGFASPPHDGFAVSLRARGRAPRSRPTLRRRRLGGKGRASPEGAGRSGHRACGVRDYAKCRGYTLDKGCQSAYRSF